MTLPLTSFLPGQTTPRPRARPHKRKCSFWNCLRTESVSGALVSRIYTPGRDPMLLTGWQLALGGTFLGLLGRVGGGALGSVTAGGAALLGYMIVLSAAAFTIWTALLGRFPVGRVSLFGFLIPVFGAVFSALVLGENIMTVRNLLSLLLVSGGIALANSAAASSKS